MTSSIDKDLHRRILILANLVEAFVDSPGIRSEILTYCPNGLEYMARLDDVLHLAWEYSGKLQPAHVARVASCPCADPSKLN